MWDDCDHAGIWNVDIDLVRYRTGLDITEEEAIKQFGSSIKILDGGDKWFMPEFVEFQYGLTLDPAVKAQRSVLKILQQYNLHEEYLFGKELPF